ncbi:FAD-binding oxidoreductase [Mucilaginibacter gotjawali]|uniref:Methane monooxygenase component C n=2 Tax=Mucilaginibacter gotjawali TaxID=1550579 RepID=A0A120MYU7_9SPHI|nr:FAD-binding oxidoreductase [Mucilaginibacter gotjawali]MBB3053616.1 ferredoxin-NADP reductase [Mucilaginibacter gotjawali]BAU53876.1 Methane monooxygenase component C [Mucilaginibacter gotjawali]
MEKHIVKVLKTEFVTHNVKRFTLQRPAGYTFTSGQATDVSINKPGLENELRPFTFTSLNSDDHLEFTIKIYTGHNGVTEKLLGINGGDELIVHEVFGAINYQGAGLFIAGGAGITPFISILRQLKEDDKLDDNILLFANHTEDDIIIKDELDEMLGKNHVDFIANPLSGKQGRRIDKAALKQYLNPAIKYSYICGPDEFVAQIKNSLIELGVAADRIVMEQ